MELAQTLDLELEVNMEAEMIFKSNSYKMRYKDSGRLTKIETIS
jgi:hypothetical protein